MADKPLKVLLVEDDDTLIDMYKMRFDAEGFDLTVVKDGTTGIDTALQGGWDVILLDVMLPKVDGFMILEEVKKNANTKNAKVILLTNLGQESDKKKGEEMGASGYLVKANFTPSQVVDKIKEIIKI
ncbi:MAG: response regulator [Candidatus Buchananbacteria bacterium CG10_big_fil_rev_8_21_14_0_10_42_9]|uniref:Response regulator n=1 Tax=Candidatus Buchananbacteria bacterium CG10_big_fil_rev_8_21_14_0_10_42_9 TaxID=1974526 RepID=A0A2H0W222_9BACT|nr:MAG: response regulator [Candidatus Buchananbacteria bacterium CG10_big_fil_rev_8_21_14_0_10_42_9]